MLRRFLGDKPSHVLIKLIVLSLLVGLILSAFELEPIELVQNLFNLIRRGFLTLFNSLEDFGRYVLSGAVIVIPLWLLIRLLSMRR